MRNWWSYLSFGREKRPTGVRRGDPEIQIILHAGVYKTGTTALQSLLFTHQDLLRSWGVFVPNRLSRANAGAANASCRAHHLLYHRFRKAMDGRIDPEILQDEFMRILASARRAGCDKILLSSELFSWAQADALEFLENSIIGKPIRVIYTVRNAHELKESLNNQTAKRRGHDRFNNNDLFRGVSSIANAKGPTWTEVILFDRRSPETAVESFFRSIGVDVDTGNLLAVLDAGERNASISWDEYWLLRHEAKRRIGAKRGKIRGTSAEWDALANAVRNYFYGCDTTPLVTMSLDEHSALSDCNERSARDISETFGIPSNALILEGDGLESFYARKYMNKNIDHPPDTQWFRDHERGFAAFMVRETSATRCTSEPNDGMNGGTNGKSVG